MARRHTPESFWARFDRTSSSPCWVWPGAPSYARTYYQGRKVQVHRLAYELAHGPVPEGLWVLHRCDNPPCGNPEHLFAGTPQANVDDMVAKGRAYAGERHWMKTRAPRGEAHPRAKLTRAQVEEIRASAESEVKLAARYGVSKPLIGRVRRREIW